MARPPGRLGIPTGVAVSVLIAATLFADSGPHASRDGDPITPSGFEVVPEGGFCAGLDREVVLRGLGRPIRVVLDGDDLVRDRSLVRRRLPTDGRVRDRRELVLRDRCLYPPCKSLEGGSKFYDPRTCANR